MTYSFPIESKSVSSYHLAHTDVTASFSKGLVVLSCSESQPSVGGWYSSLPVPSGVNLKRVKGQYVSKHTG
mgnify:CR=1 FL=1